jgi:hypothetical protein
MSAEALALPPESTCYLQLVMTPRVPTRELSYFTLPPVTPTTTCQQNESHQT